METRSSLAGQERSIFRSSGFLVSRFDFMAFHTMRNLNADALPQAFPTAPEWWPSEWGHLPVTLPWEFSLRRGDLVKADDDAAVWKEVYQLFLEQLAAGWDLQYLQMEDRSKLEPLPREVANAITHAGGFAFCAAGVPSPSYRKFLDLHPIEGFVPDQRRAKAEAWKRIERLREAEERRGNSTQQVSCSCVEQLERAVHRLGIDAQTLEAAPNDAVGEINGDVNRLASLASAALAFGLNAEGLIARVRDLLEVDREGQWHPQEILEARRAVRQFGALSESLASRFSSGLSRLR